MIKLPNRLQTIANYIEKHDDIADIGTDHGYIPLFLLQENPDRKVIFTDINEGPLAKTRCIIHKEYPDSDLSDYDIRIGDGLVPVEPGEVNIVVIAGMGGLLIRDILAHDTGKTRSFDKLILQPRTAADKLRRWLVKEKMYISDEESVDENGKFCEIIVVEPESAAVADAVAVATYKVNEEFIDDLDYEFSPILIKKNTETVRNWLSKSYNTERCIEKSIIDNGSPESRKKLAETGERIRKLRSILSCYDM